jgi:hypothetical protein
MRRRGPWSTEQIERFLREFRAQFVSRATEPLDTRSGPRSGSSFLLARVEHETTIAIEPQTLVSWDYRERMGDAA